MCCLHKIQDLSFGVETKMADIAASHFVIVV